MEDFARLSDPTWDALLWAFPFFKDLERGRSSLQNTIARVGEVISFTTFPDTDIPLPQRDSGPRYFISEASWDPKKLRSGGTPPNSFIRAEDFLQSWIRGRFKTFRWSQCYSINVTLCAILERLGWRTKMIQGTGIPSGSNSDGSVDVLFGNLKTGLGSVTVSDRTLKSLTRAQQNFNPSTDFLWDTHFWVEVEDGGETWIADATPTTTVAENGTYVYGPCRRSSILKRRMKSGDCSFHRLSNIFNSMIKKWGRFGDLFYPAEVSNNQCNTIIVVGQKRTNISQFYRSDIREVPHERHAKTEFKFKVVDKMLVEIISGSEVFSRNFKDGQVFSVSFDGSSSVVNSEILSACTIIKAGHER